MNDDYAVFIDIELWRTFGFRLIRWIDDNVGEDTYKFGFTKHTYQRDKNGKFNNKSAKIVFNNFENFTMFKLKVDNDISSMLSY